MRNSSITYIFTEKGRKCRTYKKIRKNEEFNNEGKGDGSKLGNGGKERKDQAL